MRRATTILLAIALLVPALQGGALPACTAAQHDYYKTTAPDGVRDATWHPQVDLRQGCVFDHEHGSNPALLWPAAINSVATAGYWPAFGYTARLHGLDEGHAGYKVYVFEAAGARWMVTQHMGTASAHKAACARYHTLDVVALDQDGALLLNKFGAGDYGASKDNVTGAAFAPPACPDQAAHAHGSNGARMLPSVATGSVGYEPWRAHAECVEGFCTAGFTVNTKDAQSACGVDCAVSVPRPSARGTWREISALAGFGIPGIAQTTATLYCRPVDALAYAYQCGAGAYDAAPFLLNPLVTGAN